MNAPTWHVLTVDSVPVSQSQRPMAIVQKGQRLGVGIHRIAMRTASEPLPDVEILQ